MPTKFLSALMLFVVLFGAAAAARAETPAESFAQGEKWLAQGDFAAALQAYAAAARADRENPEYLQHYTMLRSVLQLRSRLETEADAERWEAAAKAVRAFYVNERLYSELLKLDGDRHARVGSGESAAALAETQLAMERNADAVRVLSALEPDKATVMTEAFRGIALARTGKTDEAKRIADKLQLPADAGPNATYAAARLQGAAGDPTKALQLLKTCLENTAPSVLESFASHAKHCPEFAKLAATPEFAQTLQTKSKVAESKCSGGSSCAGCPMSGKCPGSQQKQ